MPFRAAKSGASDTGRAPPYVCWLWLRPTRLQQVIVRILTEDELRRSPAPGRIRGIAHVEEPAELRIAVPRPARAGMRNVWPALKIQRWPS